MRRRTYLVLTGIALSAGIGDATADTDDDSARSDEPELLDIRETLDDEAPLFDDEAVSFDGETPAVTDEFTLEEALSVFAFEHEAEDDIANFIVELEGERDELLVNELDDVIGATATPTPAGEYLMDIDAAGPWEIVVGQPSAPDDEIRTVPAAVSDEGPAVVGALEVADTVTVRGEHTGESNFIVHAYDEDDSDIFDGELIFNEIGDFEGETRMDYAGILWFDVDADGEWELDIEE